MVKEKFENFSAKTSPSRHLEDYDETHNLNPIYYIGKELENNTKSQLGLNEETRKDKIDYEPRSLKHIKKEKDLIEGDLNSKYIMILEENKFFKEVIENFKVSEEEKNDIIGAQKTEMKKLRIIIKNLKSELKNNEISTDPNINKLNPDRERNTLSERNKKNEKIENIMFEEKSQFLEKTKENDQTILFSPHNCEISTFCVKV